MTTKTLDERLDRLDRLERQAIAMMLLAVIVGYFIALQTTKPDARLSSRAKACKRSVRRSFDGHPDDLVGIFYQ